MPVHFSLDLSRYQQQRLFDLVVEFIRENQKESPADPEQWKLMMRAVADSAHIEVSVKIGEGLQLVPKK